MKRKVQIVPCFSGIKGLLAVENNINCEDFDFC